MGECCGDGNKNGLKDRVESVLARIRPALAMDGGSVELVNINEEEGIAMLHLLGSCHGCPSSSMTLLYGIENEIKAEVPEIKEVLSV